MTIWCLHTLVLFWFFFWGGLNNYITYSVTVQTIILKAYHLLSSYSNCLGVFHHTGLVIHKWALRFRRRTFIKLKKHTNTQFISILSMIGMSFIKPYKQPQTWRQSITWLFNPSNTLNQSYPSIIIILPGVKTQVHLQTSINANLHSNKHSQ